MVDRRPAGPSYSPPKAFGASGPFAFLPAHSRVTCRTSAQLGWLPTILGVTGPQRRQPAGAGTAPTPLRLERVLLAQLKVILMVKPIDTLDVYIVGRLVGELHHLQGGKLSFSYHEACSKRSDER